MKSLVLTDVKLAGGETSEVQLKLDESECGSSTSGAGELQPMQVYRFVPPCFGKIPRC